MNQTVKRSLWLGCIAFLLTFLAAVTGNLFVVSFYRGVMAFLVVFIIAFLVLMVLSFLFPKEDATELENNDGDEDVDVETVREEQEDALVPGETNESLEPEDEFIPLTAQRVQDESAEHDPKLIAQTLRRFTDE
ncbi:hypothetical protein [Brevibacillus laterosporus]|uniref:hypothetical protein n=1 Tax=Brevibacillus laterosporus TaxID=1465 RepID=UPI0003742971|nr:hypothetical protein [Brevibacillus laterosporus]ATO47931.1 hypothetical protein BrL25_01700 [Brevibacillus laterosporus DSM 25]AYB37298.1 hypothetical protein D5F52_02820 [Brevibacillus laterosporus]MBG9800078.1 hypothetical protein [Brevibacillus laterosporus]MBG9803810.1 hypothetical protein [Brevibacillus laterosporus]MBM7107519.1 hypothetical protein [Brevibacillus laterosporus]